MSKTLEAHVCAPLFISCGNALAATGQSWRWCRDFAAAHGVPLLRAGRKSFVDAAALVAAIKAAAKTGEGSPVAPEPAVCLDSAEAIRAALGKERRAA